MKYRRHHKKPKATKATDIPNWISIHERPSEADGTCFVDWELTLSIAYMQKSGYALTKATKTNVLTTLYPTYWRATKNRPMTQIEPSDDY